MQETRWVPSAPHPALLDSPGPTGRAHVQSLQEQRGAGLASKGTARISPRVVAGVEGTDERKGDVMHQSWCVHWDDRHTSSMAGDSCHDRLGPRRPGGYGTRCTARKHRGRSAGLRAASCSTAARRLCCSRGGGGGAAGEAGWCRRLRRLNRAADSACCSRGSRRPKSAPVKRCGNMGRPNTCAARLSGRLGRPTEDPRRGQSAGWGVAGAGT